MGKVSKKWSANGGSWEVEHDDDPKVMARRFAWLKGKGYVFDEDPTSEEAVKKAQAEAKKAADKAIAARKAEAKKAATPQEKPEAR